MTNFDDAKSELVGLVEEAAELVGGEWTVERFEGEGWCNFAEGVDGRNFSVWRQAAPIADPKTLAELVRGDWEAKGLEVATRFTEPDLYDVIVRAPGGFHVGFGTSESVVILRGESVCIRAE